MRLGSVLSFRVQTELDLPGAVLVVRPIQSCPDLERVAISQSKQPEITRRQAGEPL